MNENPTNLTRRSGIAVLGVGVLVASMLSFLTYLSSSAYGRFAVTDKSESYAELIVKVTQGFVSTYSVYSTKHPGHDLPVPAVFRAEAIDQIASSRDDGESFTIDVIGLPGREIGRVAQGADTHRMLRLLEATPGSAFQAEIAAKGDRDIHRSVWSFRASKQECVDCHNDIQKLTGSNQWKIGDLMGAQLIEKDITTQLTIANRNALIQAALVFATVIAAWLCGLYLLRHFELTSQFKRLASVDPLTGCINRRELYARVNRLNGETSGTLLMLDLDKFKSINDRYGHDAGDEVIKDFTRRLEQSVRADDWVVRLGGEEFLVWLPEINPADAIRLAERLRKNVEGANVSLDRDVIRYTVSIGLQIVKNEPPNLFEGWLKKADELLYRAKQEGRNRIVCQA